MVGLQDSVLIREVSLIQSALYREAPLYSCLVVPSSLQGAKVGKLDPEDHRDGDNIRPWYKDDRSSNKGESPGGVSGCVLTVQGGVG